MAIPAAYELVKHFVVSIEDTSPKTVYYTTNGEETGIDLSTQADGQGIVVFIDNTSATAEHLHVVAYSVIDLYDEEFPVQLGSFNVGAGEEGAFAFGYGLIEKGFKLEIKTDSAPASAYDVVVAIVPSNG